MFINNWLTFVSLRPGLSPSILSYREIFRGRTQAQAVSQTAYKRTVRCPLQALHTRLAMQHV